MSAEVILKLCGIKKEFSGGRGLHGIDLAVRAGEIHALVGENGAGKSTLMKILSGVYPAGEYGGEFFLKGAKARFHGIKAAQRAGIEIIAQELELVLQMRVYENVFLGSGQKLPESEMIDRTMKVFRRLGIPLDPLAPVGGLGVGQRQMVAIAKALVKEADVLIFDEPTAALSEAESQKLFFILRELREKGITILYISHRLGEVLALSDTITVLRDGRLVETRPADRFDEGGLIACMIGRELCGRFPPALCEPGEEVLSVRGMSAQDSAGRRLVDGVSLSVRAGEIVGIAGLMGAGRTELVRCIFGAQPGRISGEIMLCGRPAAVTSPREAIRSGIGLVSEDRKLEGLVGMLDVMHNITMAGLGPLSLHGVMLDGEARRQAGYYVEKLGIRCTGLYQRVEGLSGGNQQKVCIAKFLLPKPRVLILDEPTRGVDVGAKYEIYELLRRLALEGVAVLIVSSDLPEVLGLSDRILVMKDGRITGELSRQEATQERVMYYATMEGN